MIQTALKKFQPGDRSIFLLSFGKTKCNSHHDIINDIFKTEAIIKYNKNIY